MRFERFETDEPATNWSEERVQEALHALSSGIYSQEDEDICVQVLGLNYQP